MNRVIAWVVVALVGVVGAFGAGEEPHTDVAPADTWPMARGCLAGTGRSAGTLHLPLAEAWRRE